MREHPEVMNISQASDYLGISSDTLYAYAAEGLVPAFKLGNRWRFRKTSLDCRMAELEQLWSSVLPTEQRP